MLEGCKASRSNASSRTQNSANANPEVPLHIDIPTKLDQAKVVVDFGHAVYLGVTLFALGYINLLADNLREWNAKGQIVTVFHGDAAYLILNDETYNSNRHVATGNPYKKILNGLMEKCVQLELCGASAKGNYWGNARHQGQLECDGSSDSAGVAGRHTNLPLKGVSIAKSDSQRRSVMKMWRLSVVSWA